MLKRMAQAKRFKAATMIQKYLRGYNTRMAMIMDKKESHLGGNFVFFDNMKIKYETDAVVFIQYMIRKRRNKKKKEALLKRKKKQAELAAVSTNSPTTNSESKSPGQHQRNATVQRAAKNFRKLSSS